MARMISEAPAPDTESAAEPRFCDRLRDGTPDDVLAFHHVAWLVPQEGESDFVVARDE